MGNVSLKMYVHDDPTSDSTWLFTQLAEAGIIRPGDNGLHEVIL